MEKARNRFWILVGSFWTLIIVLFVWHEQARDQRLMLEHARIEADAAYNKDLIYRRWATMHGGVYVPVTDHTPPNDYLAQISERDIETPSGRRLTLVNPAYMTRQVHEIGARQYGVKGHITSLKPLSPANRPDSWEASVLRAFERGATSAESLAQIDGEDYLRVMYPMIAEERCLKCHGQQGYKAGDVRGGLGISVPMKPYETLYRKSLPQLLGYHGGVWLLGIAGLLVSRMLLGRQLRITDAALRQSQAAEAELRKQHDGFEKAQRLGKIGYWEADLKCDRSTWSGECYRIFGVEGSPEVNSAYFWERVHPDDRPAVEQAWAAALNGEIYDIEHRLIINDEVRWVRDKADIYFDDRVRAIRAVGFIQDITELKLLQEKAIRTAQMASVGELSATVAHEVNNPLSGVINYAQVLLNRVAAEDDSRELLRRIIREGERIAQTVRGVLTLSYNTGNRREIAELAPIVADAYALVEHQLQRKNIHSEIDIPENLPKVHCNPHQIEQVLLNILRNAQHALVEGLQEGHARRHIAIKARLVNRDEHSFVQLTIANNGPNIPLRLLSRIKEPFLTTKAVEIGTGLGLSVTNDIMLRHEGYFEIESEPGDYTRMTLGIPVAKEGEREKEREKERA